MQFRTRMPAKLFAAFFVSVLVISSYAAPAAATVIDRAKEAGLLPHKAIYELKLATKKSGTQVVNIAGQMAYEWQPSCEAWISNHKFDLRYEYADAPMMLIKSDFSTYESFDGKTFNFTSQRKTNDQIFEEIRGSADMGVDGKGALATYTIPEDLVFDLPDGSMFPMAHTLAVLDKIHAGKKFFVATTFDGSDKEGPIEINTFMGKPASAPEELKTNKAIDQKLLESKAWSVRLAFFPLNKSESAADYEMDIIFHENGLISDMIIDYGTFSVHQKLTAAEPLGDACQAEKDSKESMEKKKEEER